MRLLKKILDFYIYSSIHIGFAVFCLLKITVISNQLNQIEYLSYCVFFGTVLSYIFLKNSDEYKKVNLNLAKYLGLFIVFCFAIIGFLWTFYYQNNTTQKHLIYAGLLVLTYPFLRKYGWLKLFLVSFVITYITVFIPYQTNKFQLLDYKINLVQRFIFITSLMIPFEIYDSKTDSIMMKTLPQLFGINRTKLFGIFLLIPFIVLEFLKINSSYLILPIAIVLTLFIKYITLEKSHYYTSFWVESVPILWWILLFFTQ